MFAKTGQCLEFYPSSFSSRKQLWLVSLLHPTCEVNFPLHGEAEVEKYSTFFTHTHDLPSNQMFLICVFVHNIKIGHLQRHRIVRFQEDLSVEKSTWPLPD